MVFLFGRGRGFGNFNFYLNYIYITCRVSCICLRLNFLQMRKLVQHELIVTRWGIYNSYNSSIRSLDFEEIRRIIFLYPEHHEILNNIYAVSKGFVFRKLYNHSSSSTYEAKIESSHSSWRFTSNYRDDARN